MKTTWLFSILLALCTQCVTKLKYADLPAYVNNEESGFVQTRDYEDYTISLTYLPKELMAYQTVNDVSNYKEIASLLQDYAQYRHFSLRVKFKKKIYGMTSAAINLFSLKEKIKAVSSDEYVFPVDILSSFTNISGENEFVIIFPTQAKGQKMEIITNLDSYGLKEERFQLSNEQLEKLSNKEIKLS